jgi:hypothetical protein
MDELIEHNEELPSVPKKIIYPSDIPIPLMKDTIPVTGILRKNLYSKFVHYLRKVIRSKK